MKFLVVFLAVVGFGACADKQHRSTCYDSVVNACQSSASGNMDLIKCNATYGAIEEMEIHLQKFVTTHIAHSFQYLLMSTYFGNYQANRPGFSGLYRKLSDSTWDDSIDLIKHLTKRGGVMDFAAVTAAPAEGEEPTYELSEVASLARALVSQKAIALEAHHIHREATRQREALHDPEVASFLENNFVHKHADSIRDLSGHSNDLRRLLEHKDPSLALFLFDEHLQGL